jgi:hypothetical protein
MSDLATIEAQIADSARRRERRMAFVRDRLSRPDEMSARVATGDPVRFNTLSLPGWLKLAELAGVPHIPAREILSVPTEAYFDLLDDRPSEAGARIREVPSLLREGEVLRMEQVAPYSVKAARGRGRALGNGLDPDGNFDLIDMRFIKFRGRPRPSGRGGIAKSRSDGALRLDRPLLSA